MPLVVTNAGENRLLDWVFRTSGTNLSLRLYTNAYTPVATSVIGDFTEATFAGYAARTLTRASFNAATTNAAGKAEITYADQTWSATSNQTVHGYFVTDSSGNLLFAERFATSKALVSGDSLIVSPKFTLSSEA